MDLKKLPLTMTNPTKLENQFPRQTEKTSKLQLSSSKDNENRQSYGTAGQDNTRYKSVKDEGRFDYHSWDMQRN